MRSKLYAFQRISDRAMNSVHFFKFSILIKTSSKSISTLQAHCIQRNVNENSQLSKFVKRNLFPNFRGKSLFFLPKFYAKMSTPVPGKSPCIFCNIVNRLENTEILFEDDQVCVFRDIKPASKFHILTVPKKHIEDVKCLTSADKELVQHMLSVAQDLIQKNNFSLNDARLGYHWPPFRSVRHLHLHAIAPESEMGLIGRMVFKRDSFWFVSPEYVASRLNEDTSPDS